MQTDQYNQDNLESEQQSFKTYGTIYLHFFVKLEYDGKLFKKITN